MAALLTAREFAHVRKAIIARGTVVAGSVAAVVSAYFAVWQPVFGHYSRAQQLVFDIGESLAYSVAFVALSNVVLRAWLRRHERWSVHGEPITDDDREALVQLPARAAFWIFACNLAIITIATFADVATHAPAKEIVAYDLGFGLIGFTFAAMIYLGTEGALRPLYARAFATSLPARRTVGVLPRLVITWAVGSAVPLVFVLLVPLRPASSSNLPLSVPTIFIALTGLFVGALTAVMGARSVSQPVDDVRAGLQRVRDGDLGAAVEVTRPGALGALQAGFNDMVEAVRARQEIEDLFGRQVGREVADHLLHGPDAPGGRTYEASVLFVDMIGSSALAEQLPATRVVAVLNQLFDAVVDVVGAEGGWVNKFEGDGCLCVFGAPTPAGDHAARALRAARRLGERLRIAGVDAGIGVSCGEVVAGNVGTEQRFEYTVIGRPVNEASRLTDAAKTEPGHVLASAATVAASGAESVNWTSHAALALRGFSEAVTTAVPMAAQPATP